MNSLNVFLMILFLLSCGSANNNSKDQGVAADKNEAVFTLSYGKEIEGGQHQFNEGEFTLKFNEAVVKEGSYSGIEIVFSFKENDSDELFLKFELPAAKTFKVFYTNDGVKAEMPALPFTVTEKDFQGLLNALYETEQPTYIEVQRMHRIASDHLSSTSFAFSLFELNVTKAEFGKDKFSMDCSFSGKADEKYIGIVKSDYTIEGSFSISDQEYVMAEVD